MIDTRKLDRDEIVQILWQERRVNQVMLQFGRALDLHDWDMYANCFLEEFDVDFTMLTGMPPVRVNRNLWAEFADAVLGPLVVHHSYFNHAITLNDDGTASSLQYFSARHHRDTLRGEARYNQHGWYEVDYVEQDGRWWISKIVQKYQFTTGNEAVLSVTDPRAGAIAERIFGAPAAEPQS